MRAIDADALLKQFSECNFKGYTMQKLIENAPTIEVPRWIPVAERLPEESKGVLVAFNDDDGLTFVNIDTFFDGEWWSSEYEVTHWMPLPDAPKDGDT